MSKTAALKPSGELLFLWYTSIRSAAQDSASRHNVNVTGFLCLSAKQIAASTRQRSGPDGIVTDLRRFDFEDIFKKRSSFIECAMLNVLELYEKAHTVLKESQNKSNT